MEIAAFIVSATMNTIQACFLAYLAMKYQTPMPVIPLQKGELTYGQSMRK
jgi:hypothetical protein